ncbi:hypothetical protein B0W47_03790 [Komagataeibacter nataicola]|uniref:DUF4168 domain-containing protein n=3 Tax=Komagataeibacter nataicola TaxID=265960 RepID=A0A9N7GZS7_9PROT|nr:hypothetical protein B0W47_03790 [Komagataeibacter nataicola]
MNSFIPCRILFFCAGALAVFSLGLRDVQAQDADSHGPSAAQRAEIEQAVHEAMQHDIQSAADYRLPKDFFARMLPLIRAIRQAHLTPPMQTKNMPLAVTIRRTEAMPDLQAILQAHDMSARDFVMSLTTFEMTATMSDAPPADKKKAPKLNRDNVRLIQSHRALTQALLHDMDEDSEKLQ